MHPKKIAICEDHEIIVDGLNSLFSTSGQYALVGHAKDETGVLKLLKEKSPDILILDLNLRSSDGFTILQRIRSEQGTHVKILVLTMYDEESLIEKARILKANGFFLKNAGNDELLNALHAIEEKDFYIPEKLLSRKFQLNTYRDDFIVKMRLTQREVEIIKLVVEGKTNEQISEQLYVSHHTVRTHRKNIMKKLDLGNAADLVRFAYENNIVSKS